MLVEVSRVPVYTHERQTGAGLTSASNESRFNKGGVKRHTILVFVSVPRLKLLQEPVPVQSVCLHEEKVTTARRN